jgi:pyruvate/2-oxoglutarate dehydrogenase complex dihydrolipoamide acyltransferase (E2) component
VTVKTGDRVHIGQSLQILESMKMEHDVVAALSGTVQGVAVRLGDAVVANMVPADIEAGMVEAPLAAATRDGSTGSVRPELDELRRRVANTLDAGQPDVTARRHAAGRRTGRENIAELCDPGSFEENRGLVRAAQRARRDPTTSFITRRRTAWSPASAG